MRYDSGRKERGQPDWFPKQRNKSEIMDPSDRRAARDGHLGKRYVDLENPYVREQTIKAFEDAKNMREPR